MQYRRISADCHLDMLWLPPDLFTSNASKKLRELMPYVEKGEDGVERWTDKNGADYGMPGGVGATGVATFVPPGVALASAALTSPGTKETKRKRH